MDTETKIERLPEDLATLSAEGLKAAMLVREHRGREISDRLDDDDHLVTKAEIDEFRRINKDLERLKLHVDEHQPWLTRHPGFPAAKGGGWGDGGGRGRFDAPSGSGLGTGLGAAFIKQVGGAKALDATAGGATMPFSFFDRQLRDLPQRNLFVRSLIPTLAVNSDKVGYVRQTVFTNNAAAVAAGGTKPTSVITAAREEAPIRVIAHVSEAMDRSMLTDYDSLVTFIENQLRLGVLLEEEDQIINGDGTAPNISGILDQSGLQTQAKGADPTPDAILKAITKIRVVFGEPDGIVMHPNDWQEIALLRTTDGVYVWGEPANETEPRIWGKRVVVSSLIAEGTALVGAFGTAALVYEREGARITFAETGLGDGGSGEMFLKNQVRFRGESRLGLAVFRPNFFCTVTGI